MIDLQLLCLIIVANGAPILGRRLVNGRWAIPIDGGAVFIDGFPLLGTSNTYRGVIFAMLATPLVALDIGLSWDIGLMVSLLAMMGIVSQVLSNAALTDLLPVWHWAWIRFRKTCCPLGVGNSFR